MESVSFTEYHSCACKRTFQQESALTKHQRTCPKTKKRLSSALAKAKEIWNGKKRRRTVGPVGETPDTTTLPVAPGLIPIPVQELNETEFIMEVSVVISFAFFSHYTECMWVSSPWGMKLWTIRISP